MGITSGNKKSQPLEVVANGVIATKWTAPKCTCKRDKNGRIHKGDVDCPVRHRSNAVSIDLRKVQRRTYVHARMAVEQLRDDLQNMTRRLDVRDLASARIQCEEIRRYLDGE